MPPPSTLKVHGEILRRFGEEPSASGLVAVTAAIDSTFAVVAAHNEIRETATQLVEGRLRVPGGDSTPPVYIIDGVRVTRDDNIRQRLAKLGIDANRIDLGNMQWIVTNAGVFGTDPTYINVLYLKRTATPDSAPNGSRGGAAPR